MSVVLSVQRSTLNTPTQPLTEFGEIDRTDAQAVEQSMREVVVYGQSNVACDIKVIELADANGRTLPAVRPGAHVDIHLDGGVVRQYSIMQPNAAPSTYRIGVLREANSRGGSAYLFDRLQTGQHLWLGWPRNNFELDESGRVYTLIAGGIGITPLIAMAQRLVELERQVDCHYLVRDPDRAVFLDELETILPAGALHLHIDSEHGTPDLAQCIGRSASNRQLYVCGPPGLLDAIDAITAGWPRDRVHFERFGASNSVAPADNAAQTCEIELLRSGISFTYDGTQSLLEALEAHNAPLPSLCREGVCGTCAVDVIEGAIDHRDALQDDAEKKSNEVIYACVSRPTGARLVLDL